MALVLIADGDADRGRRLAAACQLLGLQTRLTTHGAAALETALGEPPQALVAQLGLPLIEGEQLGGILRTNPRTRDVATVYLADTHAESARSGLEGEIVPPPVDVDSVARRVQVLVAALSNGSGDAGRPADDSGGVEGQLSQLPLADLLQLFHVSQKTGVVEVYRRDGTSEQEEGRVVLSGGDVIHAEVGSAVGEKGLYRLLAWERGEFAFKPGPVSCETTLDKPTRSVLREGLRQIHEWARIAVNLPPLDAEVRLKIRRASLPIVIHPLTQEVLLVLEAYSRVGDIVDHCSFPDYQVLRTLHTLVNRGMVELRRDDAFGEATPGAGLFSASRGTRLREWLGTDRPGGPGVTDAKLLVIHSGATAAREFSRLLGGLPGASLSEHAETGQLSGFEIGTFGRLAVDSQVGIEFVSMPSHPRFAPLWPMGGHASVGVLLVLSGPVAEALENVAAAAETLRRLPRARIFHLHLVDKGGRVEPDALRENFSLFDESSLFLVPLDNRAKAEVLLREMFVRILP